MKRILLFTAAGVCLVPLNALAQGGNALAQGGNALAQDGNALAQGGGPRDFDPRPLASAYGASSPTLLDRETMSGVQAKAAAPPQKWHFDFMVYGLFGNLSGDATVNGHDVDVGISTQEIFNNLQFTSAGRARLSYEKWFAGVDVLYLGLAGSTDQPPVDMTYHEWIGQAVLGFSLSDRFDVIAGARYNQLQADVEFQGPLGLQRAGLQEWWDPIIGGIFKARINEHFGYQIYFDVGGFGLGSQFTTRIEPMISWYFNKHASLDLAYQGYYVDYENSSDGFAWETWTYGPLLGLSVHF